MIAQVSMKAQTLERLTCKQLELDKPTISVPSKKDAEAAQKLVTKKAYRTWANDLGILRFGGKQYIIPAATPFLKVISQNCPYGEGFAEVCFGLDVAESFYPYQLAPNLKYLSVIIPHSHLHITPKKGQTWKGAKR
jgi:hypothetical protein